VKRGEFFPLAHVMEAMQVRWGLLEIGGTFGDMRVEQRSCLSCGRCSAGGQER
jgi:hypothetical protein